MRRRSGWFRLHCAVLGLSVLAACATPEGPISTTATPEPGMAYLSVEFAKTTPLNVALAIQPEGRQLTHFLPFEGPAAPDDAAPRTVTLKLPPGRYRVAYWQPYINRVSDGLPSRPLSNEVLARPFELRAGEVIHLGSFGVWQRQQARLPNQPALLRFDPKPITQAEAKTRFATAFPMLAAQPLRCRLCTDTEGTGRGLQSIIDLVTDPLPGLVPIPPPTR
jgi:hypothetical protein